VISLSCDLFLQKRFLFSQAPVGVTPEFLRLSVGLEDIEDILWDLGQTLAASK